MEDQFEVIDLDTSRSTINTSLDISIDTITLTDDEVRIKCYF